jgi:type IV pilus assembly protein PilM
MASLLKNLGGIFGSQGESVAGIDIGSSSIKVVELKKKSGRAALVTYGEIALGPYAGLEIGRATNLPPQKLSEVIVDLLREASVSTRKCGIAIPIASSLISLIEVPDLPEKELAVMIPLEARKYIPVPVSEVTLDWWVVPRDERVSVVENISDKGTAHGRMTDVLLVAILNDTLAKYRQIVEAASLECAFFEIEIFSTIRSALDRTDLSTVMIVDIGSSLTKLSVVERGVIKNSHSINRGSQDITLAISQSLNISISEAEKKKRAEGLLAGADGAGDSILRYIFSEINRVIFNYEKKMGKDISKVILTGGGSILKGIFELARDNFQTEVVLADPFAKVEAPAFLEGVLREAGPEFAVALGVALRALAQLK